MATSTVASHAMVTTLLSEDFETLTTGDVNGQNGWAGSTAWDVTAVSIIAGTQSLSVSGITGEVAVRSYHPLKHS